MDGKVKSEKKKKNHEKEQQVVLVWGGLIRDHPKKTDSQV